MAMTSLEKLKIEHPEDITHNGTRGKYCPSYYGYLPNPESCADWNCADCWSREIPDKKAEDIERAMIDEAVAKTGSYELKTGGYESPIAALVQQMYYNIVAHAEDNIVQEVHNCGITVDKEELKKALAYDRDQYNKGFNDGIAWAASKIYSTLRDGLTDEALRHLSELLDNHKEVKDDANTGTTY